MPIAGSCGTREYTGQKTLTIDTGKEKIVGVKIRQDLVGNICGIAFKIATMPLDNDIVDLKENHLEKLKD